MPQKKLLKAPRQKRSRERVQLILAATRSQLEQDGIRALSTNSIAARAKIPVSSIYQYFPDKEAVLAAVYEEYLEHIRNTYVAVDTAENRALPWREYLTAMLRALVAAETQDRIDSELEIALGLYPVLMEIDRRHEEWIAERMLDSFQELGSNWPRAKLKRLAHYLYASNATIWTYRSRNDPPREEAFEWYLASFLAVAGKCFE